MADIEVLLADRVFLEGPRWRDDGLYVSDIHGDAVLRVGLDGSVDVLASFERPSGIGFLSDGRVLASAMADRKVYRVEHDGTLAEHADCSAFARYAINDMVTDRHGRAYLGQVGFDYAGGEPTKAVPLLRVDPDGTVSETDSALRVANGPVITADEATIVVAESHGDCLTAYDIDDDGNLSNGREWAPLEAHSHPDGICLDAEAAIWVAYLDAERFVRVHEGGKVTDAVETPGRRAVACALGGDDGRTLFLLTMAMKGNREEMQAARAAAIEVTRVDVPGCQRP